MLRLFGEREAEAMFSVLHSHLGTDDAAHSVAVELQNERAALVEAYQSLGVLLSAVETENFNRTGRREMSRGLRSAIRDAERAREQL